MRIIIIFLNVIIICICLLSIRYYTYGGFFVKKGVDYTNSKIVFAICFICLSLISGLRGNFTHDYNNYVGVFHYIGNQTFWEILSNANNNHTEILYNIINKIIYFFTQNAVVLFCVIAMMTTFFYLLFLKKESHIFGMSVLLFVTSGLYFQSFNLLRVILAAGIITCSISYLEQKKFLQFFLLLITAVMFHKTAIVGLIFFVIYYVKGTKNSIKILSVATCFVSIIAYCVIDDLVSFALRFVYTEYAAIDAYGISTSLPITSLVVPILLIGNIILLRNKINYNSLLDKICLLGAMVYWILCVCTLRVEMIHWLTFYFMPLPIVLIPNLISRMTGIKKSMYIYGNIVLFCLYSLVSSVAQWNYHLFWIE